MISAKAIGLAIGAGAAYLLFRKTSVKLGADGLRHFSPEARSKILKGLAGAAFDSTGAQSTPGVFLMRAVSAAGHPDAIPAAKFVTTSQASGLTVVATDNAVDLPNATGDVLFAIGETAAIDMARGSGATMAVV